MIGRGDESPLSYFPDMSVETIKLKIEEWLAPVLSEKNLFLVDIKINMGKRVEVFIDSDEGVHIDECALVSRHLEKYLDESGLLPANYILEVSSPGMSNPLKVARQYKRRVGSTLEVIKTNGERIEAQLVEVNEQGIKLKEVIEEKKKKKYPAKAANEVSPKEYSINFSDIKRAMLVFNF